MEHRAITEIVGNASTFVFEKVSDYNMRAIVHEPTRRHRTGTARAARDDRNLSFE
jgi:hypothetical protein